MSFNASHEYHYTSPLQQWLPHPPLHLMSRSGPFCQTHGDGFPAGGGAGEGGGGAVTLMPPLVACGATHCSVEL